jgi:hypothetical protein
MRARGLCPTLSGVIGLAVDITGTLSVRRWLCSGLRCCVMRNDSVRLTPLGEWVYVGVVSVLCVAMGYAILRAFAVVVVRLGQVLGLV